MTSTSPNADDRKKVSIHTPTKGVTWYLLRLIPISSSFNPHTHEGCDIMLLFIRLAVEVSIHTPTKGVTHSLCAFSCLLRVSIHTPTKGVTLVWCSSHSVSLVSIHTPTKGVTRLSGQTASVLPRFNPHTHEGCDYQQPKRQTRH